MLPGETHGINPVSHVMCDHYGEDEPTVLKLQVCQSAAGFYLGYWCPQCGPYSRESDYWQTRQEADKALAGETDPNLRT